MVYINNTVLWTYGKPGCGQMFTINSWSHWLGGKLKQDLNIQIIIIKSLTAYFVKLSYNTRENCHMVLKISLYSEYYWDNKKTTLRTT